MCWNVQHGRDIEVEKAVRVRMEADICVGPARLYSRKALVVDGDVDRLRRAEAGVDREGHRHRVIEGGCRVVGRSSPLMVKKRQRISERCALAEESISLDHIHL